MGSKPLRGERAAVSETETGEDNLTPVLSILSRDQNGPDPVEGAATDRPQADAGVDAPAPVAADVAHDAVAASMSAACSEIPVPALEGAVAAEAPAPSPLPTLTMADVIPIHFCQHKEKACLAVPVCRLAPTRQWTPDEPHG